MTCWALIPIKAPGEGKTRLADAMSAGEREALVEAMLRHVTHTASRTEGVSRTMLIGTARHGLGADVLLLEERGGLNAELTSALKRIAASEYRPDRVIIVAADLPRIAVSDFERLVDVPANSVAIAPDRHGTGTNALSLPLPGAAEFRFRYGNDSAERHREAALQLGFSVETIHSDGLEKDIDEPSDLVDAQFVYSVTQ